MLVMAGVQVREAADGLAALDATDPEVIDAVLLDIHLPKLGGLEVAPRMRLERGLTSQPIIALTGDDRISADDKESVFDGVLCKPFSIKQLHSTLAQAVFNASNRARGDDRAAPSPWKTDPIRLPGLDIERTLERLGGDAELLRRILGRFQSRCHEVTVEFRELMERDRRPEAGRLAHSLKGTAANLGATGIESAALRLEREIETGSDDPRTAIDELRRAVRELSASLRLLGVIEEEE